MGTDKKAVRELKKLFRLAINDPSFIGKLAENPQEVLQKNGVDLTVDELYKHLPLRVRGEIAGLQWLQFSIVMLAAMLHRFEAIPISPFSSVSDRMVAPTPPPPPPIYDLWGSTEAREALLTVVFSLIRKDLKSKLGSKASMFTKMVPVSKAGSKGGRR